MKRETPIFTGVGTAIVTPFKNGKIDYEAYGKMIEFQIAGGVDSIVVCGTTGEAATLTDEEHREVLRFSVEKVAGTKARIADTRKTTPGLRVLEKYAVKCGGGSNHRFNLADGVLIKDNHIEAAGGITAAVEMARRNIPHTLKIEVEIETFEQLNEALAAGADIIMLDNMSYDEMKKAVGIVGGRALTEASGNMGEKAAAVSGMTGGSADLFHFEYDRILIAVNGDLFDQLHIAAALALAP